jgi:hypothetical protein
MLQLPTLVWAMAMCLFLVPHALYSCGMASAEDITTTTITMTMGAQHRQHRNAVAGGGLSVSGGLLCGAASIAERLRSKQGTWTLKVSERKDGRYKHCKLMHTMYNCSRFNTSAAHYDIKFPLPVPMSDTSASTSAYIESYNSSSEVGSDQQSQNGSVPAWIAAAAAIALNASRCYVPNNHKDLIDILVHSPKPRHIFMYGDSHMTQTHHSMLCSFQERLREIELFTRNKKTVYPDIKSAPECGTLTYQQYAMFHVEAPQGMENSTIACSLSHDAETPACVELARHAAHGGVNHKWCEIYARPLMGEEAIQTSFNRSLQSINMTINSFDVIVVNTYLDTDGGTLLAKFLAASGFSGQVIVIPKFNFGHQLNVVYTSRIIEEGAGLSSSHVNSEEKWDGSMARQYCKDFDHVIHASRSSYIDSSTGRRKSLPVCSVLDVSRLMMQRAFDAKASMYPLTYTDEVDGKERVCQELRIKPDNCVGKKNVHACSTTHCAEGE